MEARNGIIDSNNYIIPSLKLEDGWFVFSSISKFLSSITPNDMPLIYCILELLRDVFHSKVSIFRIILEALKMESGFICLILIIFLLSTFPLGYTISWFCSKNIKMRGNGVNDFIRSNSLPNDLIFHEECREKLEKLNCRRRIYVFILEFFVCVCICLILSMFINNEQISTSINESSNVLRSALKDTEYFVKSTNHQLQSELFEKFDRTKEIIKIDLDDIDKLLGERITREISIKTGIDLTLEKTSSEILEGTRNLSKRVQHLLNDIVLKTIMLSTDASNKVNEIHIALSVLQRQCNYRDRPLCDTLRVKSFEEMGFIEKLRILNHNTILQKLRIMNDNINDNNLKRLTEEVSLSKKVLWNYSQQLKKDTERNSDETMHQLTIMRNGLNETMNRLTSVVKHVLDKIGSAWQKFLPLIDTVTESGYFSWIIGLLSCASTLVVTLFLIVPLSCTCCHVNNLAGITFQMSSCVLSIFCICLGIFTIFEALIGGHGEVFICRSLYEKPEFTVIGKLFDNPGILYNQSSSNGFFSELFIGPNEKAFTNISLSTTLSECEKNKSAYYTFKFDNLMDMKNTLNFENYIDLTNALDNIKADEAPFVELTQRIQYFLNDLLHDADGNFTLFRMEISQISPEKEMNNFIDQLQRVSLQIGDITTVTRMTSLASNARRVQASVLQPLELLKNEIVYQLTALELQIEPYITAIQEVQLSFNKSQEFLNKNSMEICANFSDHFRNRLKTNLNEFKKDILNELENEFGCGMLFDIFNALRIMTCAHIIEPISGLFFISFLILLLWICSTPLSLLLASTFYKIDRIQEQLCRTNTHQSYGYNDGSETNRAVSWSTRPQASIESNW
ncbi:hypothetical protein PVAND_001777 [Polypedilum vanderplanki]|uniref:Uncharacterized protein n=1 Tax=Polypedilum vanderplanki TaxID=319348 RepID=A0A9J6BPE7_POLVA|nr:hypothetical protein PVAND_001777 [Polypedilum vanderplanki]